MRHPLVLADAHAVGFFLVFALPGFASARNQLLIVPLHSIQVDGDSMVGRLQLRALVDDGLVEERAVFLLLVLLEDVFRVDHLALLLDWHPGVPAGFLIFHALFETVLALQVTLMIAYRESVAIATDVLFQ